MTTLLGEQLQYLSDEALARAIITGTYEIPSDMDPATKLILEEIGKLGIKLINGGGTKIIINPEEFLKRRKIGKINDLGLQLLSPAEESDSWHQ
jgi:hypothetical protein